MYKLTHARHDRAQCLAPGLYRSFKRGERKRHKLDVTYEHGETTLRFVGYEPLDTLDLRVQQFLVAAAGPSGEVLTAEPKTDAGSHLRQLLDLRNEARQSDALVVRSTLYQMLKELGYSDDNMRTRNDIKDSLRRMSNVTLFVTQGRREASFHMLSYAFDEKDGSLFVALNPRVTEAIVGGNGHARIEMSEVRALKSDAARLIHQRLCGWIGQDESRRVQLDTLCEYVWPDKASDAAMKKRRQAARKALGELAGMHWGIDEYAPKKFEVHRPSAARTLKD